jgi:hypothetical protein
MCIVSWNENNVTRVLTESDWANTIFFEETFEEIGTEVDGLRVDGIVRAFKSTMFPHEFSDNGCIDWAEHIPDGGSTRAIRTRGSEQHRVVCIRDIHMESRRRQIHVSVYAALTIIHLGA